MKRFMNWLRKRNEVFITKAPTSTGSLNQGMNIPDSMTAGGSSVRWFFKGA